MSFYNYYKYKSTGDPLTSVLDFTNASIGTEFQHNDGTIIIKNASGIYNKVGTIGEVEDNSITLDKLALGPLGNIIKYDDVTGVPTAVDDTTFGVGQSLVDASSNVLNTIYPNGTGRTIEVFMEFSGILQAQIFVQEVRVGTFQGTAVNDQTIITLMIPPDWSYRITGKIPDRWFEIR